MRIRPALSSVVRRLKSTGSSSAALHPLWNMLIKRETDSRTTYVTFTATFTLYALIHALVIRADFSAVLNVWPLVLLSLTGQMLYGTALITTLKRGDLSS